MNLKEQLFTPWEARKTQNPFVPTPKIVVKKYMLCWQIFCSVTQISTTFPAPLRQFFNNSSSHHWVCSGLIALGQLLRAHHAKVM